MEKIYEPVFEIYNQNHNLSPEKKNIIIFGFPRGGTTMVAGVAQLCGLNIGQNLGINLEDKNFNLPDIKNRGLDVKDSIVSSILKNNKKFKTTWGWKYPFAGTYLDDIKDYLCYPHLILVSRDPFAIATREISAGKSRVDTIRLILERQKMNVELIRRWKVPTLLVSYERALAQPIRFIEALCRFIELEPPSNTNNIVDFMRPGKYKNINVWRLGKRKRYMVSLKRKLHDILSLLDNRRVP